MWLLCAPLVIPALAGMAARPLAGWLEPRQATWLLTLSAVALAGCSSVALALLTAYAAARAPVLAAFGDYSRLVVSRGDPVSSPAGMLAGLALAAAAVAVAIIFRKRARALADSYRCAAQLHGNSAVVVVPGPAIEAYALPGRPGRIVISDPLLDCLSADGRAALIAHEQAHLSARHYMFVAAARLAAAANPMLLPVARSVEFTVERWADEYAADVTGDRGLVAKTIGRVALLAGPRPSRLRSMSLAAVGSHAPRVSLAWAGPVPRRVAALLTAPPPRRIALLAVCAAMVLVAGVAALETVGDLHALLEVAQAGQ